MEEEERSLSVNDIRPVLERALNEDGEDAGRKLMDLVEKYADGDMDTQIANVQALHEVLLAASEEQKKSFLDEAGTSLIPTIGIWAVESPYVNDIVMLIAHHSSPKEVIFSLQDLLENLGQEAWDVVEDSGMGGEVGGVMVLILNVICTAIPRMQTARSTPTLLALSDSLKEVFGWVATRADAKTARQLLMGMSRAVNVMWDWVQTTSDKGGEQRSILTELLLMALTQLSGQISSDSLIRYFLAIYPRFNVQGKQIEGPWQGGQEALEVALWRLQATAEKLSLSPDELLERLIRPSSMSPYSSLASLYLLVASFPELRTSLPSPLPPWTSPYSHSSHLPNGSNGPIIPESQDIVPSSDPNHLISAEASTSYWTTPPVSLTLLEDSMPVLSATLGGDNIDMGLTWCWHLILNGAAVPFDCASMLLENLAPISNSPSPLIRLAVFKLVSALIGRVDSPSDQVLLFKQICEPQNPWELVRVESLRILREAISQSSTKLLFHGLRDLSPIIFTLPSPSTTASSSSSTPLAQWRAAATASSNQDPLRLSLTDLLPTMWPAWFTEAAYLLRVILSVDTQNHTGFHEPDTLSEIWRDWLVPQTTRLLALRSTDQPPGESSQDIASQLAALGVASAGLDVSGPNPVSVEGDFVLDRWSDALIRLSETIKDVSPPSMLDSQQRDLTTISE